MNKHQFILNVMEKTGITSHIQMQKILKAMTDVIIETVANGDQVILNGLGTFEVRDRAARTGRNPLTGAAVQIPAKKVPAFKPGTAFKNEVNK